MTPSVPLKDIAEFVGGELCGDGDTPIHGVAALAHAGSGDITWAGSPRYLAMLKDCNAAAVMIPRDAEPPPLPAVRCDDVEWATARLLARFAPPVPGPPAGIDPSARIAPDAVIGRGVCIGPHVVVEAEARVGDQSVLYAGVFVGTGAVVGRACRIWPNVVIREDCRVGDRVEIHPNSVIGADGFGYVFHEGAQHHIAHLGNVVIEDDVEIGACACVDRAKVGSTVVHQGVKIDNLVQVAHNVSIGAGSILCAQAGVAGSTTLGRFVVLGGQVGIRDNITIADGVMVAACSCVPQDVPAGARVAGIPAIDATALLRQAGAVKRLPELLTQVRELTHRIQELEAAANNTTNG